VWMSLVANAGGGRGRPMDSRASSLDPAFLQLLTEMNLFETVYSCNAVAPPMKQQRPGKIITVSSVAADARGRNALHRAGGDPAGADWSRSPRIWISTGPHHTTRIQIAHLWPVGIALFVLLVGILALLGCCCCSERRWTALSQPLGGYRHPCNSRSRSAVE
jgi:NAD(P)-dependent dehydrogenase (short-subunit alcohol dehydrogenase family)